MAYSHCRYRVRKPGGYERKFDVFDTVKVFIVNNCLLFHGFSEAAAVIAPKKRGLKQGCKSFNPYGSASRSDRPEEEGTETEVE